jgi:hypothetical protein
MEEWPQDRANPDRENLGRANWGVRLGLIVSAIALCGLMIVARQVVPYDDDGNPLRMGSHQSIGLPQCNFLVWFGKPCPSCGMTTSFAFLVRGDVWNSVRANFVGTGLALFCIFLIPWTIWTAIRGRLVLVQSIEVPLGISVGVFTVVLLVRWALVLLIGWLF